MKRSALFLLICLLGLLPARAEAKTSICSIGIEAHGQTLALRATVDCWPNTAEEVVVAASNNGGYAAITGPFTWVENGTGSVEAQVNLSFTPDLAIAAVGVDETQPTIYAFGTLGLPQLPEGTGVELYKLPIIQLSQTEFAVSAPNNLMVPMMQDAAAGRSPSDVEILYGLDWHPAIVGWAATFELTKTPLEVFVGVVGYDPMRQTVVIGYGYYQPISIPKKTFTIHITPVFH